MDTINVELLCSTPMALIPYGTFEEDILVVDIFW